MAAATIMLDPRHQVGRIGNPSLEPTNRLIPTTMTAPRLTVSLLLLTLAPPTVAAQAPDVHRQLLDLAERQQQQRRAHFAAVGSKAELEALQRSLCDSFLKLLDG